MAQQPGDGGPRSGEKDQVEALATATRVAGSEPLQMMTPIRPLSHPAVALVHTNVCPCALHGLARNGAASRQAHRLALYA